MSLYGLGKGSDVPTLRSIRVASLFLILCASAAFAADGLPDSITLKADYATTWKAALILLADYGWLVTQQSKEDGVMGTDWKVMKVAGLLQKGLRVRINLIFKKVDENSTELTPKFVFESKFLVGLGGHESDLPWEPATEDDKYGPMLKTNLYKGMESKVASK